MQFFHYLQLRQTVQKCLIKIKVWKVQANENICTRFFWDRHRKAHDQRHITTDSHVLRSQWMNCSKTQRSCKNNPCCPHILIHSVTHILIFFSLVYFCVAVLVFPLQISTRIGLLGLYHSNVKSRLCDRVMCDPLLQISRVVWETTQTATLLISRLKVYIV